MPTHDMIIDNAVGATVRADINSALAALVANSSNATAPATMYAYQWWADTTTGLLKIRNAANTAWITVGTLASTNLGLVNSATWHSNTYTPTITNGTNVAASTSYAQSNFTIEGGFSDCVVVVDIDPTAAGAFDFEISTPVASAFTSQRQAGGAAVCLGATSVNAGVVTASTADKVKVSGFVADTGNLQWRVSFRMIIL